MFVETEINIHLSFRWSFANDNPMLIIDDQYVFRHSNLTEIRDWAEDPVNTMNKNGFPSASISKAIIRAFIYLENRLIHE